MILLYLKCYVTGHQGQVECANGILKHIITKFILDEQQTTHEDASIQDRSNVTQNWVEQFHHALDVANHAPKPLTGITALEVHFPEKPEAAHRFTIDEAHEAIYYANREALVDPNTVVEKVVAAQTK